MKKQNAKSKRVQRKGGKKTSRLGKTRRSTRRGGMGTGIKRFLSGETDKDKILRRFREINGMITTKQVPELNADISVPFNEIKDTLNEIAGNPEAGNPGKEVTHDEYITLNEKMKEILENLKRYRSECDKENILYIEHSTGCPRAAWAGESRMLKQYNDEREDQRAKEGKPPIPRMTQAEFNEFQDSVIKKQGLSY
jgi:hypothetical protein